MADITLKLIWYRLGETFSLAGEKCERFLGWYEDFSWSRVDFLDMLFLGWLLAAFVVVGAINLYLRFFGRPKNASQIGGGISPRDGETTQWLNTYLQWLHKHYLSTPEFVEAWIRAVNEQLRKNVGEYQIKVDRVQEGSPLPRVTHISTADGKSQHCHEIRVGVEARDSVLLVSAIQQSPTNVRVTNCDVVILELIGQMKVQSKVEKEQMQINMCFASEPKINMQVRPKQIDSQVSVKAVEQVLQGALASSVTSLTLNTRGGYPQYMGGVKPGSLMSDTQITEQKTKETSKKLDVGYREPLFTPETIQTVSNVNTAPVKSDLTKYESLKREQIFHGIGKVPHGPSIGGDIIHIPADSSTASPSLARNDLNATPATKSSPVKAKSAYVSSRSQDITPVSSSPLVKSSRAVLSSTQKPAITQSEKPVARQTEKPVARQVAPLATTTKDAPTLTTQKIEPKVSTTAIKQTKSTPIAKSTLSSQNATTPKNDPKLSTPKTEPTRKSRSRTKQRGEEYDPSILRKKDRQTSRALRHERTQSVEIGTVLGEDGKLKRSGSVTLYKRAPLNVDHGGIPANPASRRYSTGQITHSITGSRTEPSAKIEPTYDFRITPGNTPVKIGTNLNKGLLGKRDQTPTKHFLGDKSRNLIMDEIFKNMTPSPRKPPPLPGKSADTPRSKLSGSVISLASEEDLSDDDDESEKEDVILPQVPKREPVTSSLSSPTKPVIIRPEWTREIKKGGLFADDFENGVKLSRVIGDTSDESPVVTPREKEQSGTIKSENYSSYNSSSTNIKTDEGIGMPPRENKSKNNLSNEETKSSQKKTDEVSFVTLRQPEEPSENKRKSDLCNDESEKNIKADKKSKKKKKLKLKKKSREGKSSVSSQESLTLSPRSSLSTLDDKEKRKSRDGKSSISSQESLTLSPRNSLSKGDVKEKRSSKEGKSLISSQESLTLSPKKSFSSADGKESRPRVESPSTVTVQGQMKVTSHIPGAPAFPKTTNDKTNSPPISQPFKVQTPTYAGFDKPPVKIENSAVQVKTQSVAIPNENGSKNRSDKEVNPVKAVEVTERMNVKKVVVNDKPESIAKQQEYPMKIVEVNERAIEKEAEADSKPESIYKELETPIKVIGVKESSFDKKVEVKNNPDSVSKEQQHVKFQEDLSVPASKITTGSQIVATTETKSIKENGQPEKSKTVVKTSSIQVVPDPFPEIKSPQNGNSSSSNGAKVPDLPPKRKGILKSRSNYDKHLGEKKVEEIQEKPLETSFSSVPKVTVTSEVDGQVENDHDTVKSDPNGSDSNGIIIKDDNGCNNDNGFEIISKNEAKRITLAQANLPVGDHLGKSFEIMSFDVEPGGSKRPYRSPFDLSATLDLSLISDTDGIMNHTFASYKHDHSFASHKHDNTLDGILIPPPLTHTDSSTESRDETDRQRDQGGMNQDRQRGRGRRARKPRRRKLQEAKQHEGEVQQHVDREVSEFMNSSENDTSLPQQAFHQSEATSPSGSLQNRRLLAKIIKANGLGDKDFACTGPYCVVQLDEPTQKYSTSMVKNTVNPFWDEHFIFDLAEESTELKLEVYDRDKPPGLDFLGRAVIAMGELKRMPSSRQIIPLTGKPGATTTSGSVTVEFLFMEADSPDSSIQSGSLTKRQTSADSASSPRRRIETNRTVMPGGMVVTSKTTLTEKPRDHRAETGYMDSPSLVEKTETTSNYTAGGDLSSFSSGRSSLGAHEAGLTASQGFTLQRSTLPPSSLFDHSEPVIPVIKTPDDMGGHNDSLLSAQSGQASPATPGKADVKKSKSFADTLKRKFQRKPKSSRSQSVDRASSMKERSLLRPPEQQQQRYSESEYDSDAVPEAGIQKQRTRSRSFGSSLRRLFKGKHKDKVGKDGQPLASRESSVSRQSARSATGALTMGRDGGAPRSAEGGAYGGEEYTSPYSTSVPVRASPLYDQYNSH